MTKFHFWWIVSLVSVACLAEPQRDLRLVDAVKNQDRAAVLSLLQQHADPNVPEMDGTTALAWAAHWDDLESADVLIHAGAAVNAANEYGATALWLACVNGNAVMVERLLKAGADPNTHLLSGETALMTAAEAGSADVVQILLAHGANPNTPEMRAGQTALMWAVAEKHTDIVRALVEHGADVHARSKNGFTPLLFAAQQGQLDSAEILLAAGADANEATPDGTTPLLVASSSRQEKFLIFLMNKGVSPNAADVNGYTALHFAAASPNTLESVKTLLAHGANPNARLAKDPAKGDSNSVYVGATPFLLAAEAHNLPVMRLLAANGADPLLATTETMFANVTNGYRLQMVANTTPLMMAAGAGRYKANYPEFTEDEQMGAVEAAKLALELGADVNATNEYGQTALHAAAYLRADSLVQLLVDHGAKMDVIDNFGQTPLSIALRVYTIGVRDSYDLSPRRVNKSTGELLLKMGATPLAFSGVQVLEVSPQ